MSHSAIGRLIGWKMGRVYIHLYMLCRGGGVGLHLKGVWREVAPRRWW